MTCSKEKNKKENQTHKKKKWKVLLKKFCSKTTLKALPRVSKAKSFHTRLFWFSIFASLFTGAVLCVYLILQKYLKFSTYIETTTEYGVLSPFPSITICAHRPMQPEMERLLAKIHYTPKSLAIEYEKWAYRENSKQRNITGNPTYVTPVPYPRYNTYYQYMPSRGLVTAAGRKQNNFIWECLLFAGTTAVVADDGYSEYCNLNPKIIKTTVTDSTYFNCYMHTFNESHIHSASALTFILNLESYYNGIIDSAQLDECHQCIRWKPETWRRGARVTVHAAHTRPNVEKDGIDLNPGSLNEVVINTVMKHRMKAPYGICKDGIENEKLNDKGNNFSYTAQMCENEIMQKTLKSECKCVDPNYPIDEQSELELAVKNISYCEAMNLLPVSSKEVQGNEQDLKKIMCAIRVKNYFNPTASKAACPSPCKFYDYKTKIKSTNSFDKSMLRFLYNQMRKDGTIKSEIAEMEAINKDIEAGNYTAAYEKLNQNNNFMNNFVHLTVKRSDFSLTNEIEKASIELPNVFSMIGGICSLFIGFSLFVCVEMVELIIHVGMLFIPKWAVRVPGLKNDKTQPVVTQNGRETSPQMSEMTDKQKYNYWEDQPSNKSLDIEKKYPSMFCVEAEYWSRTNTVSNS